MFILTNINIDSNAAQVYDTTDNTVEGIALSVLADSVCKGYVKVYGISRQGSSEARAVGSVQVNNLGIAINANSAKTALMRFYIQNGVSAAEARRRVGLAQA